MSLVLAFLAFFLILIGVKVQVGNYNHDTKFAVTWTTLISALCFLLFAAKVYFT
jgi:hypothetical protein